MEKEIRKSYWDKTGKYQADNDRLWDAHVPNSGDSDTIEGELIRAIGRLFYEYCNNGNCNAGEMQFDTCGECGGTGYENEDCCTCNGEGTVDWGSGDEECNDCGGSGESQEDCCVCNGDCKLPEGIEITDMYSDWLKLIERTVGCTKEVEAVCNIICDTDKNYNYDYSQKEMNIYNTLCDVVIEYVLEKEKTGFTKK